MGFTSLGIDIRLINKLDQMNIKSPTSIQSLVIGEIILKKSIVATAQTGSGKTLAYLLPLVQNLQNSTQENSIGALVLAPTRELAQQISAVCNMLCEGSTLKCATIYGGVEYEPQKKELLQCPDIVISTPGRLIDLINQGALVHSQVEHFVVDEIDQMLSLGFRDAIIELSKLRSQDAQTLCFSATLPPHVTEILESIMPCGYKHLSLDGESLAVEKIEMQGYYVSMAMMDHLLLHLIQRNSPGHAIIFTRSRKMADRVAKLLVDHGIKAEAMHSEKSQAAREYILSRFKDRETQILVATDIIARGIDVDDVDQVYNFGLPLEAEQYIHRIGRTARAGRSGLAITLCTPEEKSLLGATCKLMKRKIPMIVDHPYYSQDVGLALAQDGKSKPTKKKRQ